MIFTVIPPMFLNIFRFGDIHVIKPATRSSRRYRAHIASKDSYCTVENSNTMKIIREYKAHGNNGGDTMDLGVSECYLGPWAKFSWPVF